MVRKIIKKINAYLNPPLTKEEKINLYISKGRIPWSEGYEEYKWSEIKRIINDTEILKNFKENRVENFGIGIDERIIEYPWILAQLTNNQTSILDAGSTFNYKTILDLSDLFSKKKTIITYSPEKHNYNDLNISYIYSDLRDIPIKDEYFDEIVCQSTLEHIDMDNSIYGHSQKSINNTIKSYEYLKAVNELYRVLKKGGTILITVPYGVFENHGFFQQFDREMIDRIKTFLEEYGTFSEYFFKYEITGWKFSNSNDCDMCESYNPHTQIGRGDDNAAHSRAICCIKFKK